MASRCAACANEMPESSRFCPACGAPLVLSSQAATERWAEGAGPAARRAPGALSSSTPSSAISGERFAPGTVLGGRYRIASRLGKGGMGEVYRADDLKLSHVVALKFLPEQLVADAPRLARFHHEVKIARQISHPNVCRVYDIAEADGQHFISMEYVDGEDLRSLLRRIGRLPADKAIQIARQLCAGLAAAHDKGVLHRDLKPANVMLDGEGRVRVTDFGLAALAGEVQGAEIRSGTPTYMAPEQLAGKEVSVASDVYALGLVLFELFTGTPVFRAASLPELMRLHAESGPASPSSLVPDLDPAVERVILRCLAKHPTERPSSALAVAAALPGGDPLAAALAAGETPSPAMVAAAGEIGGLKPGIAWACLLAILGGFALAVYLMQAVYLTARSPLPKEPAVLVDDARRLIESVGWKDEVADASWGFERNEEYLAHLKKRTDAARWEALGSDERSAYVFWYRQSPRVLIPYNLTWPKMSRTDPPPIQPGMVEVRMDPAGQLLSLHVVPQERDESGAAVGDAPAADWGPLLAAAGLGSTRLESAAPTWTPPIYADARAAWVRPEAGRDPAPGRVEAASYRGRPVFFRVVGPWVEPATYGDEAPTAQQRAGQAFALLVVVLVPLGAALLARRNLRLGRGDRKGSFRIAGFFLATHAIIVPLTTKHFANVGAFIGYFTSTVAGILFSATLLYVLYLAMEPYVRRRWPDTIISWSRLLSGRFRDPLVGRDVLFGLAAGVAMALVDRVGYNLPAWLGAPPNEPVGFNAASLLGFRWMAGDMLHTAGDAPVPGMFTLLLLLLLTIVLRRRWIAVTVMIVCVAGAGLLVGDHWSDGARLTAYVGLTLLLLMRVGLLATAASEFVGALLLQVPLTLDFSRWYAYGTVLAFAACAVVAGYAFHTALAGRPLLGDKLLEE
jgi:serine/threonine-protein kinase